MNGDYYSDHNKWEKQDTAMHECCFFIYYKFTYTWYNIFYVFVAYESLQSREETRNSAWQKEGWDVNVYYTGKTSPATIML